MNTEWKPIAAHWYAVDKHGAATLCTCEEDARATASESAQMFPNCAPYTAVQLAPVPAPTSHPIPTGATGEEEYGSPARILRQFLSADGYIAECDIPEICARLRPAPAAGDALDALRELVACDNIKKQIASMQVCVLETDDDVQELDGLMSDLARRQPAAWEAARAAIAQQSQRKEA